MDELELSRRSVYRVFDLLEQLNIHREDDQFFQETVKRYFVSPEQVQKLGLPIPHNPDISLNLPESLILQYLFQSGGVFKNTSSETILQSLRKKLSILIENPATDSYGAGMDSVFQVSTKTSKNYSGLEDLISDISEAIVNTKVCTVTYFNFKTEETKTYEIHPLKIVEQKGGLYLFVRVVKHNTINILAVERISQLTIGGQTFKYPPDFDPESLLESAFDLTFEEPITVKIRFSGKQVKYIRERIWAKDQKIESFENGTLILSMTTSGFEDIKRWVLQYGSEALVLEPASLRLAIFNETLSVQTQIKEYEKTLL